MQDVAYIKRCIELAELSKGYTAPNPMVGAVLVHEGRVIGEGRHERYGEAHAEVNCLASVKDEDRELVSKSTMYVNLEPCAHYGKTPPCAVRLAEEKVKRVVIANQDPFEKVGGRGIDILKSAGAEVVTGVLEKEGAWLNRRFFCFHTKQRPYIILKWAQTARGFFAPADRSSYKITNRQSQQLLHKWRTGEAAIMVGYQTALSDNPQLTARLWEGKQPLRIVLDRKLQLPVGHHLFDGTAETWVVNEQKDGEGINSKLLQLSFDNRLLPQLMNELYEADKLSLIVEGGAQLLGSFIDQGLWDEARVFTGHDNLEEGVRAPALQNERVAFETNIGGDQLRVYTNRNNPFSYPGNMEL
ncbi:MAG: bifunctional diaminohydroxyphosphoribosylaminopyrimidine deaminase/5-amino-6-(5-phosphoribosylamino)uracil reductase RibD [Bacteroidetes bacterium]|nr:bifunctional diaminohydroxyphosphoribosylaminopyrimidine deaminase/5-amino-6-(5-phosphoribosylamino)uracil reductase RibD [Bacteroidota bacterium]